MSTQFRVLYLGLAAVVLAGSLLGCDALIPWLDGEDQQTLQRCTPVASTQGPVGEWERLMSGREIKAVAADPCDPRVIYAGSTEGLFKSTDGGASWDSLSAPADNVNNIEIDPYRPDTVYSQQNSPGFLLKSSDGGATWKEIIGSHFITTGALEMDPKNPETLYTGSVGIATTGGIAKSTDGGDSWKGLINEIDDPDIISISPADPQVVYVVPELIVSPDGGKSWVESDSDVVLEDVAVSPKDAGVLYGVDVETGRQVVRSRDSAHTWNTIETGLPPGKALRLAADSATGELFLLHQVEPEDRSARVYRWDEKDKAWQRFDSDPLEVPVSARTALVLALDRSLYLGKKGGLWRMKLGSAE